MIIGLTTKHESNGFIQLNEEYLKCVKRAGGTPLLIPPLDHDRIDEVLDTIQGLVLVGGEDIDPVLYGQDRPRTREGDTPLRDTMEVNLARKARAMDLPCLGVCRGMQMMNVALGGSLIQDIPTSGLTDKSHEQQEPFDALIHKVSVTPGSKIAQILDGFDLDAHAVNSIHHQAVDMIAPGLQVGAVSEDGIIEAIEDPTRDFFVGIQWHPEYLDEGRPVFDALHEAARRYGENKK